MLAEHPIDVMLLASDLGVAREFYADKLGLEVLIETDDFLTFECGGDSRLVVTRSATVPTLRRALDAVLAGDAIVSRSVVRSLVASSRLHQGISRKKPK